jgi:membrane-bound serine protease (ClpP class)
VLFVLAVVAAILWIDGPWAWVLVGVAAVVEIGESFLWVWWSRRRRSTVGAEAMIGRQAVVVLPCRPEGQVRIDGELWQARCDQGADPGQNVTVEALEGLTLVVRPGA